MEHEEKGVPPFSVAGMSVAILPFPALGDVTIYLRLAWNLCMAGAQVQFFSSLLYPARDRFTWLDVRQDGKEDLVDVANRFDLVIACFERCYCPSVASQLSNGLTNVAFVTAKKIPRNVGVQGREVVVRGRRFADASTAFCRDSGAGLTMVDWVDTYARDVFGISVKPGGELLSQLEERESSRLVLIFPTTPQPKKNYWLLGFRLLGHAIRKNGWDVEYVGVPKEHQQLEAAFPGFVVRSFVDINGLIDHVSTASVVISNDSGGGHLASLIGLKTFTITRRGEQFTWRPGFNNLNTVLHPYYRFKLLGRYIWRPFVPVWRVPSQLGRYCKK